jgi:hypothetical protein
MLGSQPRGERLLDSDAEVEVQLSELHFYFAVKVGRNVRGELSVRRIAATSVARELRFRGGISFRSTSFR